MGHEGEPSIDDEAIRWFVLLNDEDATDEHRRQFELWRTADPRHDAAWHEVLRMWGGLDQLADKHAPAAAAPAVKSKVVPFPKRRPRPAPVSRGFAWKSAAAAAVIVLAIGAGWQMMPTGLMADYRSGVGERQTVRLDDGSEVELGTATAMNVDFTGKKRVIELLSGEAFFTVAKDSQRPFVVTAKQGKVEVLGTAFNVRIADDVTVAVAHNTVEVSAAKDTGVRVTQGEMVHFDRNGVSPIQPADLETIQAWRSDKLVFADVPLSRVIAELQRYRSGHIQILGSDIGNKRVTAVFDTRRTDEAIDTIAESYDLKLFRLTNLWVGILGN